MIPKLQPKGDRVLVQVETINATESGIVLTRGKLSQVVTVLEVGPEVTQVKPGDEVFVIRQNIPPATDWYGSKVHFIREESILGVWEKDEERG